MRLAPLAFAALALGAASAAAAPSLAGAEDGDGLRAEAQLHARATSLEARPSTEILFDRATRTYRLGQYLVPDGGERYGSTITAVRLEGRHLGGGLRWTLAADTGEVRRRRGRALETICLSAVSPTGLDLAGQLGCVPLVRTIQVEGTGLAAPALESNGRPLRDELSSTLLLREANLAWSFGRAGFATLRAGRSRYQVANGLVHDDYATGADLRLDLGAVGPPFELRAAVFQPTRDFPRPFDRVLPVVLVQLDWLPSLFEHAGLFLAAHRDRTDGVAELFRGARLEDAVVRLSGLAPGTTAYKTQAARLSEVLASSPGSDASTVWAGTSGTLVPFRSQRLSWTGAVLGGRIHRLEAAPGLTAASEVPLSGRAASLRWDSTVADWLTVSPWFLLLSGDRSPYEKGRLSLPGGYGGFLGITPYLTATNLFFGGGLSESFAARQATAPGVNGRGVVAPGLSLEAGLPAEVELAGRVAWLRAQSAGPYGGKVYGTEIDLELSWAARPWLTFGAEVDALFPGDFFGGSRTMTKVVLAVDVVTP